MILAVIVINKPTITMATATYINVLSSSLEVDPTAPLLCVGEVLAVQFKLPATATLSVVACNMIVAVIVTDSVVVVTDSVVVVTNSVVVSVTVISSIRPESVPPAVPLVILML